MSNDESVGRRQRISSRTPTVPDYRTLLETEHGRMRMPAAVTVIVDVDGDPNIARVELDAVIDEANRRYLVSRVDVRAPAGGTVHPESLRRLDFPTYLRNGVAHLIVMEHSDGATYTASNPMHDPDPLWQVALAYSVALALGEPPTGAVADDLQITHNAAAQRVKSARAKGYLPPTKPGKAS